MAEQTMIACDNPKCDAVGVPEHIPGEHGEKKRKGDRIMAPYGWHQGDGWVMGCGPNYTYFACSDACCGPAIEDVVYLAREEERRKYE